MALSGPDVRGETTVVAHVADLKTCFLGEKCKQDHVPRAAVACAAEVPARFHCPRCCIECFGDTDPPFHVAVQARAVAAHFVHRVRQAVQLGKARFIAALPFCRLRQHLREVVPPVGDHTGPTFGGVGAGCGVKTIFSITVSDPSGVAAVWGNYYNDAGVKTGFTMGPGQNGYWVVSIFDTDLDGFDSIYVAASDSAGNTSSTRVSGLCQV